MVLLLSALLPATRANDFQIGPDIYQRVERIYGTDARARVERWRKLLHEVKDLSEHKKLEAVNRFFNELHFVSDADHWGQSDYWATPLEFLGTNGGDCEDFSVAKYFSLKELGVSVDRLQLTYVKSLTLDQAHMVVTYLPNPHGEPLVLDNLVEQIRPASMRKDLVPVYSFSGEGLWLAKERGRGRFVGKANRLSRWRSLTERMAQHNMNSLNSAITDTHRTKQQLPKTLP